MGNIVFTIAEVLTFVCMIACGIKLLRNKDGWRTIFITFTCLVGIVLILFDFLKDGGECHYDNLLDLAIADLVLLSISGKEGNDKNEFAFAIIVFIVNLAIKMFPFDDGMPFGIDRYFVMLIANAILIIARLLSTGIRKFSSMGQMQEMDARRCNIQEYIRFNYIVVFFVIVIFCLGTGLTEGIVKTVMSIISAILFLSLFVFLCINEFSGNTFPLSKLLGEKFEGLDSDDGQMQCFGREYERRKMKNLYDRIVCIMEEKQPFLDGDFDMDDLSKILFSNKLYLSRTINIVSRKNFRQFVNYYRIQYAMDLIRKDPRMKLMEVAEMSGFHSSATFNMAFKLNTGQTPTEWINSNFGRNEAFT